MSKDPRQRLDIFLGILRSLPVGRLLDLGCGHGVMSLAAKELGWVVTAVDVRSARMPMTPGIEWIKQDVRTFGFGPGDYDCVAILGLLYHLRLEEQLQLLRRASSMLTIVDTHVSLNPTHDELGYAGETFDEVGDRSTAEHAEAKRSSWGNETSFWPDEPSLLRMFSDSGFAQTFKLAPSYRPDRTFYVCHPQTSGGEAIAAFRAIDDVRMRRTRARTFAKIRRLARRH